MKPEEYTKETLERIEKNLLSFIDKVENKYVTKEAFEPVQKGFYFVAGSMIMAIIGALISLVV